MNKIALYLLIYKSKIKSNQNLEELLGDKVVPVILHRIVQCIQCIQQRITHTWFKKMVANKQ